MPRAGAVLIEQPKQRKKVAILFPQGRDSILSQRLRSESPCLELELGGETWQTVVTPILPAIGSERELERTEQTFPLGNNLPRAGPEPDRARRSDAHSPNRLFFFSPTPKKINKRVSWVVLDGEAPYLRLLPRVPEAYKSGGTAAGLSWLTS